MNKNQKLTTGILTTLAIYNFISSNIIDINQAYKNIENYKIQNIGNNKLRLPKINNTKSREEVIKNE